MSSTSRSKLAGVAIARPVGAVAATAVVRSRSTRRPFRRTRRCAPRPRRSGCGSSPDLLRSGRGRWVDRQVDGERRRRRRAGDASSTRRRGASAMARTIASPSPEPSRPAARAAARTARRSRSLVRGSSTPGPRVARPRSATAAAGARRRRSRSVAVARCAARRCWASCTSAWVSRWRSSATMPRRGPVQLQSRGAERAGLGAAPRRSAPRRRPVRRRRKSGRSALASMSRSSTSRRIRSSSSSTSASVSRTLLGIVAHQLQCPRTMVIGVRSSWPASSRNAAGWRTRPRAGRASR